MPEPLSWNSGLGMNVAVLPHFLRGVLRAVLVPEDLVGHLRERVEAHVDLGLAAGGHLVVVHLDPHADRLQGQHHVGPDVLELVHRRHREVALLVARLVAEVRLVGRALLAAVPGARRRVDEVVARVVVLVEADGVEEEELQLGPDEDRVGHAGLLDVGLGLLGDVAGVARVPLAGDRVLHVADQDQRGHRGERIHLGRARIRDQQHVGLVDGLEPPDRRAVEAEPVLEDALAELGHRDREVLPETRQVDEAEIDDLDAFLLGQLEDILGGHARLLLLREV